MKLVGFAGMLCLVLTSGCDPLTSRDPAPAPNQQIAVVPLGKPSRRTLDLVEAALRRTYNVKVVEVIGLTLPPSAYLKPRNRYDAIHLLAYLSGRHPWKSIGVTDCDISTPAHGVSDFGIMGRADIGGSVAVVSSFRSKAGVGTVAIHEIGHTLGLPHCPNIKCVMVDAKGTARVAQSSGRFCASCASRIKRWLRPRNTL